MELTDREWRAFQIGTLFDRIDRGNVSSAQSLKKVDNGVPYVGATVNNNGVIYFVECDDSTIIQDGNCIAFIRDGQGSVGLSIYRETPCVATVNVSLAYHWLNSCRIPGSIMPGTVAQLVPDSWLPSVGVCTSSERFYVLRKKEYFFE